MPTVLITGANRGIGLALTEAYLSKGYIVIAAVRDTSRMPKVNQENSLLVIKLDSAVAADVKEAIKTLTTQHNIHNLDLVIANAGVNLTHASFSQADLADLDTTYEVNIRGPIALFQAVKPLLGRNGKFVVLSSGAGCIDQEHDTGMGIYGLSKAAINYFVAKSHAEEPDLTIIALAPGWVDTDMGNTGASWLSMDQPPGKVSENIPGMIKVIDEAKKDRYSGRMVNHDGTISSW